MPGKAPSTRWAPVRLRLLSVACVLLIAITAGMPAITSARTAATPLASPTATAIPLSTYRITAAFHLGTEVTPATITGTEDLTFVNNTGESLPALYFRLYANAPEYAEGGMSISGLTAAGLDVATTLSAKETVLKVPLPRPLAAGDSTQLHLEFTTTVPVDPRQSYGMFGYNSTSQTWALAHWYPVLAGWDPLTGWNLDLWAAWGDAIFTNTSRYDVTLAAPASLVVAASGHLDDEQTRGDMIVRHYLGQPIRDFAFAIGTTLRTSETRVGQTVITSYFLPDDAAGGAWVLQSAAQSLAVYNRLFGAYPYKDLAVVEVPLRDAAGVEFPQLVMIGAGGYRSAAHGNRIPDQLDFTVGHEVAHQWWFGIVGNNQYQHAFLDESLTNYTTVIYFEQEYGEAAADRMVDINFKLPYFTMLFSSGDQIVDQPTNSFQSDSDYVTIIYSKGPLGFAEIRHQIGDGAFFAGLRLYRQREEGKIATPADLLRAFDNASGRNVQSLWNHWFDQPDGKQDFTRQDFMELANELGR